MRDLARRSFYRVAARLMGLQRFLLRPTVRGVRCVLTDGDEAAMVRHTYGDRAWAFPGGLLSRRESPAAAARREIREELGIDVENWRSLGVIDFVGADRARHVVACFTAPSPTRDLQPDRSEIAELRWVPLGRLPDPLLDGTREIAELARAGD